MAHFAELDKDNKVLRVIVISNDETHDADNVENEALGVEFCKKLFGAETKWVQTSFNNSIRKFYAGVGDTYDAKLDEFVPSVRGEIQTFTSEEIAKFKEQAQTIE
jgi:hypothetical protein